MIKALKLPNFLRVIKDTVTDKTLKRTYFPGYSNPDRRLKRTAMRRLGISGKQYRKWLKLSRRDKNLAEGYLLRIAL